MDVFRLIAGFTKMPGAGHMGVIAGIAVASAILRHYLKKQGRLGAVEFLDRVAYVAGGLVAIDLILKFGQYAIMVFGIF